MDGIPSQVEIDRCTHIEAKHYPWSEYKNFTPAERQKHFQLTHKDILDPVVTAVGEEVLPQP